jgi:hypothetical protein
VQVVIDSNLETSFDSVALLKVLVGVVKLEFKQFWLACAFVKSLSEFLVLTPELLLVTKNQRPL